MQKARSIWDRSRSVCDRLGSQGRPDSGSGSLARRPDVHVTQPPSRGCTSLPSGQRVHLENQIRNRASRDNWRVGLNFSNSIQISCGSVSKVGTPLHFPMYRHTQQCLLKRSTSRHTEFARDLRLRSGGTPPKHAVFCYVLHTQKVLLESSMPRQTELARGLQLRTGGTPKACYVSYIF